MTQDKLFFELHSVMEDICNADTSSAHKKILSILSSMNPNLKIYVVRNSNDEEKKFTTYRECLAEWNNNAEWNEMYSFNPFGECSTIKTR